AGLRMLHAVGLGNFMLDVSDQREGHSADAALVGRRVAPGGVGELGVDGDTDHLYATLGKSGYTAVVCQDFGGTDEGEIERVKEQHDVLAGVVGQREVFLDGAI